MQPVVPETRDSPQHLKPFVTETLDTKSLQFSSAAIQSSMNLLQPDALVLEYTQTMMGFLMFNAQPRSIAMIGLGGGSLAKFCHRYLPKSSIVVVEINPHVLALRDVFLIPKDNRRFTILQGDGAHFVRCPPKRHDVLMLDAFEASGLPDGLSSQHFFDQCHDALHPQGILVVNLHSQHPQHNLYVARIRQAFKEAVLVVDEPEGSNTTVFACKGSPLPARFPGPVPCPAGLPKAAWSQLALAFGHIATHLR